MADAGRKEKLVAAKKKLKQFQKSSRTPSQSPVPTADINKTTHRKGEQNGSTITQENQPANLTNSTRIPNNSPHQAIRRDDQLTSGSAASHGGDAPLHSTQTTPALSTVAPNERLTASTEQLQQLSRQINGLISQSDTFTMDNNNSQTNNGVSDLEKRNRELAQLLEQHSQANEQLNKQLQDLKNHNVKLQNSLDTERKGFDEKLKREIGALKEQLQVHIQTIGILVAEKTEIQSSLNQKQKTAEHRQEEIEELSGRLKASRQRVAELEKSFTSASSLNQKNEKSNKDLSKDVDRLKLDLYKLNKSSEEFQQQTSELQGKLQQKVSECGKLEDQLILVRGQLEMAQLNNQQLQSGGVVAVDTQQVEQLLTEKGDLQAQLKQYDEAFQKVSSEREQIAEQYQQYVEQLTQQSASLQAQIGSLVEERDQLLSKQEEFTSVIGQLQNKQDTAVAGASEVEQEREQLVEKLTQLMTQHSELSQLYEAQVTDNAQLSRLVGERETHIEELELQALRLSETQVDSEKLLEHIQNDKTALSRAIAQNRELKTQLAELQNGFVKMSNENMELMTQLQKEQHISKELANRLAQQEEELKEIRSDIGLKDQELQRLRLRLQTEEGEGEEATQLEHRLQEFQQQAPLLESLQRELSSAQDAINALTNQNSELKSQLLRDVSNNNVHHDVDNSAQMEQMSVSIRQLEMERNEMLRRVESEEKQRQVVQKELDELRSQLATQTPATLNGDVINKAQFEALQHAMKQLELKYTKVMREQAELSDSREQLEHIVMQLQGETETIGEYVALYQQQRFLLKQRQLERDDYVSQMARDHQHMQDKLAKLQTLVVQLLDERHRLHSAVDAASSPALKAVANHTPQKTKSLRRSRKCQLEGTVNSDDLEDWPGSSSSGDESETNETVPVIGGAGGDNPSQVAPPVNSATSDIPLSDVDDRTAQQIMLLLSEIGNSNVVCGDRLQVADINIPRYRQMAADVTNGELSLQRTSAFTVCQRAICFPAPIGNLHENRKSCVTSPSACKSQLKYTKVMREQAELSDSREQLEHIVMQLQGETETIGEYVALYQQQRFLLKQRQLERDDYVSQMARDHQHMQDKLAKLQTLVVQLLDERHRLHSAVDAASSPALKAVANHTPQKTKSLRRSRKWQLEGTVNSDDLEDWPGSSSSGDESDTNETVPVIGGAGGDNPSQVAPPVNSATSDIPLSDVDDRTAQQIMLLLSEIGNSNVVCGDSKNSFSHWNYLQCNRCVGRMIVV